MALQALERLYKLTVDANQATRELKKVNQRFDGLAHIAKRLGGALAGVFATQFSVQQIRSAIEFGDALAKTADKVGVSVEALQQFRFAAEQSGVASDTLDMALQRFARRSGEAAQGTGELVKVYQQLGISMRDSEGGMKSTEKLFREFLKRINAAPTQMEKLRLAFKGFDSEGAALVNMAGDFEELTKQANQLGLVMEEGTARQAEILQDRLTILATQVKTTTTTALIELAAAVGNIFNAGIYADLAGFDKEITDKSQKLAEAVEELQEATARQLQISPHDIESQVFGLGQAEEQVIRLRNEIIELNKKRDDLYKKLTAPPPTSSASVIGDDLTKAADALETFAKRGLESLKSPLQKLEDQFRRIDLAVEESYLSPEQAETWKNDLLDKFEATATGVEYEIDRIVAALRVDTSQILKDFGAVLDLRLADGAITLDEYTAAYQEKFDRLNLVSTNIDTGRLDEAKGLFAELGDEIANLNTRFADDLIRSLEDGGNAFKSFADAAIKELARIALSEAFASLFSGFGNWVKNLGAGGAIQPNTLAATPVAAPALLAGPGIGQTMNVGLMTTPTYGHGARSGRRGGVNINVNNYGNDEVQVEQRQNRQGGVDIDILIEQKVNRALSNGSLDRTLSSSFGIARRAF